MKFSYTSTCECGGEFVFKAIGQYEFEATACTQCGKYGFVTDPLSVSITAERLLYRSKEELEAGDYSLAILLAAIAVESFLTRLFLKFKGMENYMTTSEAPNQIQEDGWELEYPRSGGFEGPANFVSKRICGKTFDEFVTSNNVVAAQAFLGLPNPNRKFPSRYFQDELFKRRNRIAHWGFVNSTRSTAEECHRIGVAIVTILREMDRLKYGEP
jgi:hypothetical protein